MKIDKIYQLLTPSPVRCIVCLSLTLMLGGCLSEQSIHKWRQTYGVPIGSTVSLVESLSIPARHTRAFIQDGRLTHHDGYQTGYNQFYPFCYFETARFSSREQTIEPDRFTVVGVGREETQVVSATPVLLASVSGGNSSVHMVVELTILTLSSDRQPDVTTLACGGGFQDPGDAELPTIKEIAEVLGKNLEHNQFHKQVMSMGFQNILTTNYDYCLEKACSNNWERSSTAQETLYSLFRRNISNGVNVWHIHGELGNPKSIMIGHDQYTGYSQKISNFLSAGVPTESKERKRKPYISKFSKKASKSDTENWVDLFIEDEVHMIGFSLDYTENHLWSLISRKNKLRKKYGKDLGAIIFHNFSIEKLSIEDEARFSLLNALGVEIKNYHSPTYEQAYSKFIKSLRI